MLIDCGTCVVRGDACNDCVVTVLLGPPAWNEGGTAVHLAEEERAALAALAESGLVPPLRLVEVLPGRDTPAPRRQPA